MFPAQALAEEMLARGWRVTLSTDDRGARYAGGFPASVARSVVPSATPARGGAFARLAVPLRIARGILAARAAFRADRPSCVVGFGGYPAIPAMAAAITMGLPRLIHEANGVPGRVNRRFATRASAVACGVWPTVLPRGARGVHTGNPVRAAVRGLAGAPYPPGGETLSLLVIGGSQGARLFSRAVPQAIAQLDPALRARLAIAQQVRADDVASVMAVYGTMGVVATLAPFFEDVAGRLAGADLVISRAGASSVAELAVTGRPSILIPFAAAADDHQTANARALGMGAVVIGEDELTAPGLAAHIAAILGDPARAGRMSAAARAHARPDAAARLADLVETTAAHPIAATAPPPVGSTAT